ncbi:hypothetical protein VQ042_23685 [Aurantimonas sp. A2-1-M11]|uniref:hypothetical protein n=1 Tax=Aurantimonas sp. A2-1-M11 TaxID=3113712 RepID=UPI002F92E81B
MKTLFATATAIALFVSPAFAQDAQDKPATAHADQTNGTTTSAEDQMSRDNAMQSAKGAGMTDVAIVDRAFVLRGTNAAGNPVFMIVDPPGALIGIGAPIKTASSGQGVSEPETTSSTEKTVEEMAGEPAQSGYMATQVDPASPQMWDPMSVEREMRDLGLDKPAQ